MIDMDDEPQQPERDPWWQQVDWTGAVALVLALGVSLSMSIALVGGLVGAIWHDRPISEHGAAMLSTIFGAAIGALASYLGQSRERQLNAKSNGGSK